MSIDRRTMLGAAGLALAAGSVRAQAPAAPAPAAPPSLEDRLAKLAAEHRHRLDFDGTRFSGPAWDLLLREGRAARFFLLGEDHGIAENPAFAGALYAALAPDGYDTLAIETSPLMAAEMDRAAQDGVAGLRRLFADPDAQAAFYTMAEEARMLATVRAASPGPRQVFWGLDYDVAADRLAVRKLKPRPKPSAAEAALAALEAETGAAFARYNADRGPQHLFNFSADPALVAAVRQAWPGADPDSAWMLHVMEETLHINRLFFGDRNQASNQRRADLNKANLLRYWRAARAEGRNPRALFKFGASHMIRGLSNTEVFDLGTMLPELAAIEGGSAFHLLVTPGAGSATAAFDPSAWTYRAGEPRGGYGYGLEPVAGQAFADAFTLIDLRPMRELLPGGGAAGRVHRELARAVHGFDAVLVMSGSTPSTNL